MQILNYIVQWLLTNAYTHVIHSPIKLYNILLHLKFPWTPWHSFPLPKGTTVLVSVTFKIGLFTYLEAFFIHSEYESCVSTILSRSDEDRHPCLVPNFRGKVFSLSLWNLVLSSDWGCFYCWEVSFPPTHKKIMLNWILSVVLKDNC